MIRSMTGFARRERQGPWGTLVCELRTVNHRYLETSLRLPDELKVLDNDVRQSIAAALRRGKRHRHRQSSVIRGRRLKALPHRLTRPPALSLAARTCDRTLSTMPELWIPTMRSMPGFEMPVRDWFPRFWRRLPRASWSD